MGKKGGYSHSACRSHPFWIEQVDKLQERMCYQKAVVVIARKMLVSVWHILKDQKADRHCIPEKVANRLLRHVYDLGKTNRDPSLSTPQMVRKHLDALGIGQGITKIRWSETRVIRI